MAHAALNAAIYLDSLFPQTRVRGGTLAYICVALYAPLGLVLALYRLVVCMPLIGFARCLIPSGKWRTRFIRFSAAICFCNFYRVKGRLSPSARIIAANHTSEMDVLPFRSRHSLMIMGYDLYTRMWWLKYSPLRCVCRTLINRADADAGACFFPCQIIVKCHVHSYVFNN